MRKLLVVTFALTALPGMLGCQCCLALVECENQKNQWLKDHFCCHHNRIDPAVAPMVAVPVAAAAVAPVMVAPPAQPVPYISPPVAICPPVAAPVCPPMPVCPPTRVCPPVAVCPPVQQCCPPVQQCCPQLPVVYDPPGTCCEPMCCP